MFRVNGEFLANVAQMHKKVRRVHLVKSVKPSVAILVSKVMLEILENQDLKEYRVHLD